MATVAEPTPAERLNGAAMQLVVTAGVARRLQGVAVKGTVRPPRVFADDA